MDSKSSYKQIVKSTGAYGLSQLINIVLGVVRSKVIAILLGTVGVGLIGLYQSVIDLSRSVTGLGLDTGATKEIAVASSSAGGEVSKTLYVVNIWYLLTAVLGALLCVIFAKPLSIWAFDSGDYSRYIAYLSIAVIVITLNAFVISCLQGLRKITYMALASTLGSFINLLITIPIYYYWRLDGIVPMFIIVNLVVLLVGYYFYRKIDIKLTVIPLKAVFREGKELMQLGLYMVVAGVLSTGSLFLVRIYISRDAGVDEVGLFQAAWLTTTLIWGIVLRSANSDFFPRLCSIIEDKVRVKNLINQQTHIVLLIISPLIIGLITFADFVIYILYSSDFVGSIDTFRWHMVGTFLKIVSTPLATILLAKNKGLLHLACEAVFWCVYLIAFYILYSLIGLEGTGIAYLVAYVVYLPFVLAVSYRLSNSSIWNRTIVGILSVNILLLAGLYLSYRFLSPALFLAIGTLFLLLTISYSIHQFKSIFNILNLSKWVKSRIKF